MLALALAPALVQAFAPGTTAGPLTLVCTSGGWRLVTLDATTSESDGDRPLGMTAPVPCPWCPPVGPALGAHPIDLAPVLAAAADRPTRPAHVEAPVRRAGAEPGLARGPPAGHVRSMPA